VKHGEIGTVKRKDGLSFCIDCFSILKTWKDGALSCVELLSKDGMLSYYAISL
jgi:hypothetical protein